MSSESPLRELICDLAASLGAGPAPGGMPLIWSQMVGLGLAAVGVPESRGGSDGSIADLAEISESLGQYGIGVPMIHAATANWVLAAAGGDVEPDSLSVVVLTDSTLDAHGPVSSRIRSVPWARSADRVIVYPVAGPPLAFMTADPEVAIEPGANLAGEHSDTVVLTAARATILASAPPRDVVAVRLGLLWSAALVGAVRGAYELTRDYVRTREQFGAPLIKIPAVAAGLATIRTQLLQAEATVNRAVALCSAETSSASELSGVGIARIICATAATETARTAHQLHGAMGITAEYPLHRFTTKLWAWRDAVMSEGEWSRLVGGVALEAGEQALWGEITATQ